MKTMKFIDVIEGMAKGAAGLVILVTALPICGGVGVISAVGAATAAVVGAAAGLVDVIND